MSAGYKIAPSAIIVTPDAPVKAVKSAHARIDTMAKPDGIQPKKTSVKATNLFGALLSLNKYPERVKRGIADRKGISDIPIISITIAIKSISCDAYPNIALAAITEKSGVPIMHKIINIKIIYDALH